MRAKRSKKYRKLMHQYELTFGFREPYQVLVDSNFLRAIYAYKMELLPALERTLHGKVKPLLSKCSLAALYASHSLKSSHQRPPSLPPPTTLPMRHCSHNAEGKPIDETSCLLELLGGTSSDPSQRRNKEHYILASSDPLTTTEESSSSTPIADHRQADLRSQARDIPGVPIIYVKRSVMVLEEMSSRSTRAKRGLEKDKYSGGMSTTVSSRKRKRGDDNDKGEEDEGDQNDAEPSKSTQRIDRAKRAKGPNPLSVRKPKRKAGAGEGGGAARVGPLGEQDGMPKAKRKRRHKKTSAEGHGGTAQQEAI